MNDGMNQNEGRAYNVCLFDRLCCYIMIIIIVVIIILLIGIFVFFCCCCFFLFFFVLTVLDCDCRVYRPGVTCIRSGRRGMV